MFVPGERVLSIALESDTKLLDDASKAGVTLAGPGTLLALLKTVEAGWQAQKAADNARSSRRRRWSSTAGLRSCCGTSQASAGSSGRPRRPTTGRWRR